MAKARTNRITPTRDTIAGQTPGSPVGKTTDADPAKSLTVQGKGARLLRLEYQWKKAWAKEKAAEIEARYRRAKTEAAR